MRVRGQFMLLMGILAACGDDDPSTATTGMTVAPMTMSSHPSGDTTPTDAEESGGTGDSGGVESNTSMGEGSTPTPGAPVFLSLQTNVSKITAGDSVIFTAVLTDPDGVDDIVGGTLSDPTGMIGYGPFIAAGQEGAYSITLSWDAVHQADPIEFEGMDLTRVFHAEFYDQTANEVGKDVELKLTCTEGSACDGVCVDIMTDVQHCGACNGVCDGGCQEGSCAPKFGECIEMEDGFPTCGAYCASVGEGCAENSCDDGATIHAYGDYLYCEDDIGGGTLAESCNFDQPWSEGRMSVRCCCTDTK